MDFFDPSTWEDDQYEYRIYADDYANDYAIVDQIDYQFLVQWRWRLKPSRIHKGTKRVKSYLARVGHEQIGTDQYEDGIRLRSRIQSTIFLHTIVMQRKGIVKPKTNKRIIVDHADGNERNCRRNNLRYTTISFNNMNINGSHHHSMFLEEHI
jgi:hypothetical protein